MNRTRTRSRARPIGRPFALLATVGLALMLALSACGGDEPSDTRAETSTTEHNDADVDFATAMIPHHAQALVMVDLTQGRDLDPEVTTLADEIRAAQGPEIETMSDWLTDWGQEVPETMRDHVNSGHDHGDGDAGDSMEGMDHDMPGMMSPEQMTELEQASDADFQTMWLEMMVDHHEGAVEMAETEQTDGRYEAAVEMAGAIIDSQNQEIETMQGLLGQE